MRNPWFAGALVLAVGMIFSSCGTAPPASPGPAPDATPTDSPQRLNVGLSTDRPGLGMLQVDGSNVRSGFDVDFARWLTIHAYPGFDLAEINVTAEQRVPFLTEGRVDLVIQTFSITDERRKSIGFAGPYIITQQGILVRAGDNRINNLDDLNDKNVCLVSGTTGLEQLNNREKITLTEKTGTSQCVTELLNGRVDAFSTDELILQGIALSDSSHLAVQDFTFGALERYGVGLPKGDTRTCEKITSAIQRFIIDGTWDQFFRFYFPNIDPVGRKPSPDQLNRCV